MSIEIDRSLAYSRTQETEDLLYEILGDDLYINYRCSCGLVFATRADLTEHQEGWRRQNWTVGQSLAVVALGVLVILIVMAVASRIAP